MHSSSTRASLQEAAAGLEAGSAPRAVALPVGLALRVGRPGLLRLPGRRRWPTLGRALPIAAIVLRRRLQGTHTACQVMRVQYETDNTATTNWPVDALP